MAGSIFLNYRRRDIGHVGRIYDWLSKYFGPQEVFMDVIGLGAGDLFEEKILKRIVSSTVFISVISRQWEEAFEGCSGDELSDLYQKEVKTAFDKKLRIIPVLVGGAEMPSKNNVPIGMHGLLDLQAVRIVDLSFGKSIELLVDSIESTKKVFRINELDVVRASCKLCDRETYHKQSKWSKDRFDHDCGTEDDPVGMMTCTTFERVRIRHCNGCGTPHLVWVRDDSESGGPPRSYRFEAT